MSLTFRNVPNISKRRGRSESKTKNIYKSRHFKNEDQYLDEFPPLKKTMDVDGFSLYDDRPEWKFTADKSFEEVRWKDYQQDDSNVDRKHLQCLIKSKFCCQKNQNAYYSKPEESTKSLANILGELKERVPAASKNMEDIRSNDNSKFNNILPFSTNADFKENPIALFKTKIDQNHTTLQKNLQKQTSLTNIIQKRDYQEPKNSVIVQKSQVNLNLEFNLNRPTLPVYSKSVSNFTVKFSPSKNPTTPSLGTNNIDPPKLLSKISEEHSNISIKTIKERSIHTINEPVQPTQVYQGSIVSASASQRLPLPNQDDQQQSLFPNTTWFLQDNLSDQFGFNSALGNVEPIFEKGNLYAECYDFPTVQHDLFRTMVPENSPVVSQRKDFKVLFSPYGRHYSHVKRWDANSTLF